MYYGEELGLRDSSVCRKNMQDPLGRRYWPFYKGRDPQRGPMVWNVGGNHGFTDGEPWLPFTKRANWFAVENQELEQDSMLFFYRSLIELRTIEPAMKHGVCVFQDQKNTSLMVYTRTLGDAQLLVVLNFSSKKQLAALGEFGLRNTNEEIYSTSPVSGQPRFSYEKVILSGYEGVVFRL